MTVPSSGWVRERPGRLRVGVISSGRVGSVLGSVLAHAGHSVVATSAVSDLSLSRAAAWLPEAAVLPPDDVAAMSDLVLLAVPDDALSGLVIGLAATGSWNRRHIVVHTSGAHGLAVLEPAVRAGAVGLAIHPALSLTARAEDAQRIVGARFGVTAPEESRAVAEALVVELGGEPVWVPDDARPAYHAALTAGANHLVTLVNDAADLLRIAGVGDPAAVLAPLLFGALDNALRMGDAALTGPVSRGDATTVRRHVDVLTELAPEIRPAYVAMARRTAARAMAAGRLDPSAAARILDVLAVAGDAVAGDAVAGQEGES